MRADFHIEFDRPLNGVKLHSLEEESGSEIESNWICGVRDKMAQDAALLELLVTTVEHIETATAGIAPQIEANLQSVAALATEIGLAVAREVVGQALTDELLDPSDVVLRCLRQSVQTAGDAPLRIELAPSDLDRVIAALDGHPELRSRIGDVDFVPNPDLGSACVQITTAYGSLVYDPQEVLDRVCEEIRKGAV